MDRLRDWTTGMVSYDSILAGLKEVTAKATPGADSSSEEEREQKPKKKAKVCARPPLCRACMHVPWSIRHASAMCRALPGGPIQYSGCQLLPVGT